MMEEYHYLARMRPPGPGAVPREGLLYANCQERWIGGQHYWGEAVYNRRLPKEEADHYELEELKRGNNRE